MENQMINLKCRKCGAHVNAEQKKCPKCGAPILLKVMMEEEKRHLPAKEIREKDKRMRREYDRLSKEKEQQRQKDEKKKQALEERKERAQMKVKAELEALRAKEDKKKARAEQKKAKVEAKNTKALKKAEEKKQKKLEKGEKKSKFPIWIIVLIAAIVALSVATVIFLNLSNNSEPVDIEQIETPAELEEVTEEPIEEIVEEPQEAEPQQPAPVEETPAPEQKPVRNITRNNYLFPSDTQYLTESDVSGLSKFDTGLIRNEIYARKGYVFKDDPYKSYFNSQAWYNPNPSAKLYLNEIEKYNVNFLLEYERSQGWR